MDKRLGIQLYKVLKENSAHFGAENYSEIHEDDLLSAVKIGYPLIDQRALRDGIRELSAAKKIGLAPGASGFPDDIHNFSYRYKISPVGADNKISSLTVIDNPQSKRFKIIVNGDDRHPVEVSATKPTWAMLRDLARGEAVEADGNKKSIDYLNSNKRSTLYKSSGCDLTKIVRVEDGMIVPAIPIKKIKCATYRARKNSGPSA